MRICGTDFETQLLRCRWHIHSLEHAFLSIHIAILCSLANHALTGYDHMVIHIHILFSIAKTPCASSLMKALHRTGLVEGQSFDGQFHELRALFQTGHGEGRCNDNFDNSIHNQACFTPDKDWQQCVLKVFAIKSQNFQSESKRIRCPKSL